jgi:hypothetical protein
MYPIQHFSDPRTQAQQSHNFRISLDEQKISLHFAEHQRVPLNLGQQKFLLVVCGAKVGFKHSQLGFGIASNSNERG